MESPPMKITARQLATKRFRFWVRWDTLLLNLLVPFTNRLNQHQLKYGDETPPTPEELKQWGVETGKSFVSLSVAEAVQVVSACSMINHGGEALKCVAYQFDVSPRLKASYYAEFLTAVRLPFVIKILGFGPAMQATSSDLEYDAAHTLSSRALATFQRSVIPTTVQFITSLISAFYRYLNDADTTSKDRRLFQTAIANLIICAGSLGAQITGALVGHTVQGPTAAFLIGDVCHTQFLQRMPPKIDQLVRQMMKKEEPQPEPAAVEDPNTLTNVSLATE